MTRYVYELIDESGTPFYVGQSKLSEKFTARRHRHEATHQGKNYHLPRCQRIREILDRGETFGFRVVSRHKTPEEADEAERQRIKEIGIENLTNIVNGGVRGFETPDEIRQRLSNSMKGRAFSEEHRRKLQDAARRRDPATYRRGPFSPAHRKALSNASKQRKRGPDGRFR